MSPTEAAASLPGQFAMPPVAPSSTATAFDNAAFFGMPLGAVDDWYARPLPPPSREEMLKDLRFRAGTNTRSTPSPKGLAARPDQYRRRRALHRPKLLLTAPTCTTGSETMARSSVSFSFSFLFPLEGASPID